MKRIISVVMSMVVCFSLLTVAVQADQSIPVEASAMIDEIEDIQGAPSRDRIGYVRRPVGNTFIFCLIVLPRSTYFTLTGDPPESAIPPGSLDDNLYTENTTVPKPVITAESLTTNVTISWDWSNVPLKPRGVGHRIFRSEVAGEEGISITDFYLEDNKNSFNDVNVKPDTLYYYTVRQVINEANPWEDKKEELGPASDQIIIFTGDLLEPDGSGVKKYITMTIDEPIMDVNGENKLVDPDNPNIAPINHNNRVLVPIRAIVENMGGTIEWYEDDRRIEMDYNNKHVEMFLDQEEFLVDGVTHIADVPPQSIEGRTRVPIRFAAESLGCVIEWLASRNQVVIVYY